ncbi:hypothetical protein D3C81_1905160 [compost metagenome]
MLLVLSLEVRGGTDSRLHLFGHLPRRHARCGHLAPEFFNPSPGILEFGLGLGAGVAQDRPAANVGLLGLKCLQLVA